MAVSLKENNVKAPMLDRHEFMPVGSKTRKKLPLVERLKRRSGQEADVSTGCPSNFPLKSLECLTVF
jgi:hypothetical protein